MSEDNTVYFGICCWFDPKRGMGFLEYEIDGVKQKDMFVHFTDIIMEGFKTLYKQQRVSFQIGTNRHGDPKAINVTVLKN
jgi:CspA family cold shock protein